MLKLILTNGKEELSIPFKVRNTPIAKKWFDELCKDYPLFETDRFTNWGTNNIIQKLITNLNVIRSYDSSINVTISNNITQQELNHLHKYFEDLRGEIGVGTNWFNNAPGGVQDALMKFNILIHQLEADLRTVNHPTVVVTFKDRPNIKLKQEDLKYFTFRWTSGTVYINYCQVGKTVLDMFKDKDKIAKGVRPQEYYSADFMVKFGPTTPYIFYLLRKLYINIWIKFQPFKFKNPNLGMIPVADLVSNIDRNHLKKFNKVKGIECIE